MECLDVVPGELTDVNNEGFLALNGEYYVNPDAYLIDFNTGNQMPLPLQQDEVIVSYETSPNRAWLAYYTENRSKSDTSRILVVSADGLPAVEIPVKRSEWWSIVSWLDNERLLIDTYVKTSNIGRIVPPVPMVLWNPFTGDQQELLPEFPGIYENLPPVYGW